MTDPAQHALDSARHVLFAPKRIGDGALAQCSLDDLAWEPEPGANSIATIVRHMHGNMISRFTDFLESDGEKPWRDRDGEFDAPPPATRDEVLAQWEEGWACVARALDPLTGADILRTITIRGQRHTVIEAIHRQVQHYGYHVGQIVLLARLRRGDAWQSLSIARGASKEYRPSGKGGEARA